MFILLFFGSKSIPKISRNLGRGMRYVKDATQEIQNDIRNSANEVSDEIDVKDQELTKNNGKDIE
jgi:Sec-independent protein translocase protein TatA